ncbi:MAG: dihydroorotase, partial [Nitrospirales bacterium]
MAVLIKGGRVIDPGRINGVADVLVDRGRVVAVGPNLLRKDSPHANLSPKEIDATGLWVVPG